MKSESEVKHNKSTSIQRENIAVKLESDNLKREESKNMPVKQERISSKQPTKVQKESSNKPVNAPAEMTTVKTEKTEFGSFMDFENNMRLKFGELAPEI